MHLYMTHCFDTYTGKLVTKNTSNEQEYFEVDGVDWIDGSVQADLPFKRICLMTPPGIDL